MPSEYNFPFCARGFAGNRFCPEVRNVTVLTPSEQALPLQLIRKRDTGAEPLPYSWDGLTPA
jgi:hypothetical protein